MTARPPKIIPNKPQNIFLLFCYLDRYLSPPYVEALCPYPVLLFPFFFLPVLPLLLPRSLFMGRRDGYGRRKRIQYVRISMLHKGQFHNRKIEPRKGQREPLCSNGALSRCPFLSYEYIEGQSENIDRAFDILFQTVLQKNK